MPFHLDDPVLVMLQLGLWRRAIQPNVYFVLWDSVRWLKSARSKFNSHSKVPQTRFRVDTLPGIARWFFEQNFGFHILCCY
jgi:hypothetical protein